MDRDWHGFVTSLLELLRTHVWWIVAGMTGRLMFHSREAQAGRRRFWGRELPFELFLAIGMGMAGNSLCAYFAIAGAASAGVVSTVAYLGPRALDVLFDRLQGAAGSFFARKGN